MKLNLPRSFPTRAGRPLWIAIAVGVLLCLAMCVSRARGADAGLARFGVTGTLGEPLPRCVGAEAVMEHSNLAEGRP